MGVYVSLLSVYLKKYRTSYTAHIPIMSQSQKLQTLEIEHCIQIAYNKF